MIKSEQIELLTKALVSFQKEMKSVGFDANNPFFKSKYATLTAIVDSSRALLSKNGLAVTQLVTGEGGVTTLLLHDSGQFIGDTLTLKATKDDPQGHGSAITYARRYAYASILGIVSDEDDDGNVASEPPVKTASTVKIDPSFKVMMTVKDMCNKMGVEKLGSLENFKVWRIENNFPDSLEGMKDFDIAKIIGMLREIKK